MMKILHGSPGFGGVLNEDETIDFLASSKRTLVLGTVDVSGHKLERTLGHFFFETVQLC